MDAFLLDAPQQNRDCASIEDLALQLAHLRETKASDTRAEHLSETFEFGPTVVFNVPENGRDAEPSQNPDQAPGETPGAVPAAPVNGNATAPTVRAIRAIDTLMNQPTDDPALQNLVAKHIIAYLGSVDGSSWTVRSVSRNSSGWTFTYLCRNSTQAWMRQNLKHSANSRIAESSGKDGQDPVHLSRPAFDCRGSVAIAFAMNNRKITVKLEHTPLHKTVAELAELFKPPPPLPRAEATRKKDGERKKRKIPADGAGPEEGTPKRRKKKMANADELAADGEQAPKPKKPRAPRVKKKAQDADVTAEDSGQNTALLNLSPLETARRQEEASKKLWENGIDPATLSAEQFDIFANQSPDLQQESLAMLVKYGAERLRIVHPNKDNMPQSGSSDPANGGTPTASKKENSRRKAPREDGVPKVKKTRGSCQACRAKKVKCTKGQPECEECVGAGIACYYPPPQSRKRAGAKSAEVAEDEPEPPEVAAGPDPVQDPAPASEPVPEAVPEEEASDLGSPGFGASHHPDPGFATPHPAETTDFSEAHNDVAQDLLYQPASSGLSYPQGVGMPDDMSNTDYFQTQPPSNGIAYHHLPHQSPDVAYTDAPPASRQPVQEPEPVDVQPSQTASQPTHTTLSRTGTHHSLPSGSAQHQTNYSDSANAASTGSSWQMTNIPENPAQAYSESPAISQAAPPRPNRSRQSAAPSAYDTPSQDALQAATTLANAALQQRTHTSPTTRTASPFANPTQAAQVARAKSRQSQRPQGHHTASPFQQSATIQPTAGASSLYNAPAKTDRDSMPAYDQYSRYNNATPQTTATTRSRVAYEPYSQQAASNSSATSYSGYGAYNSRSQAPNAVSLPNPVTQSASSSYTKTATPSSKTWASSNGRRSSNTYSSNKVTASSGVAYNVPTSAAQQSAAMQSFNVRPQSTTPTQSRPSGNTATSYSQQPQQPSQQTYNSYHSQPQPSTHHQQQQQQQEWYGFGSTSSATSNYGSGSYGQHRSMNLAGNTYSSMNDQDALYEMLRNNSRH